MLIAEHFAEAKRLHSWCHIEVTQNELLYLQRFAALRGLLHANTFFAKYARSGNILTCFAHFRTHFAHI